MTAPLSGDWRHLLDALSEPTLILDVNTRVLVANRAANARLGTELDQLAALASEEGAPPLRTFVARCSGSRQPLPGATALRCGDGALTRFRCTGNLLTAAQPNAPALVLLRLFEADDKRFSVLAEKVRELNVEVRERRRTQVVLEEALRDRELLLRELHHRVKNSIQMLVGMVSAARRDATVPEAKTILTEAARRLDAVGAVHQLLYRADDLETLAGDRLVKELSLGILRSYGAEGRLSLSGTPAAALPNDAAMPLALILNELVTNAVKYGPADGQIRVGLDHAYGVFELVVEDDGPGFEPSEVVKRASGLGLVRGLVRQLGGRFAVSRGEGGGARCLVRFQGQRQDTASNRKTS